MESPNREQTLVPVTDLGSPVFKYLCSLSPIKPAKQLHVAQTYSELTFPTAPVVFVSPQGLRKEGSCAKSEDPSSVVEAARPIAGIEYCGVACVESSKRLEFAHNGEVDSFQGSFKHDACTAASPASSPSNPEPYVEEYFADHMEETMYPMSSNGVRPNIDMTFKPAEDLTSEDAASSHTFFDHKSLSHPPINCVQFSFKSECTEDYHFNSENCVMTAADDLLLDDLLDGAEELGTHHGADADFPSVQENSENFAANELSFTLLGILDLDSKPDFISPFSSQSQGERTSLKENSVQHTGCPSSLKEAGALEIEHIQNSGVKLKVSAKSQRCFRRRCLDFDATKSKRKSSGLDCTTKPSDKSAIVSQCTSTLSSTQNVASMLSERAAATSDAINSTPSASGISIGMASSGVQRGNRSRSITPFHSPPSGLGLHLNSLGSRMLTSSNGVPGLGGLSTSKTIISGSLTKSTAIVISKKFESPGSSLQDSFVGHGNVKQETIGSFHSAALGGKRLLLHDFTLQPSVAEGLLESPQSPRQSPRKKRKQAPGDKPAEECKRCNCKKSKCLKLYCECFAAGLYCEDSCLCHDCHNKLRFQETVDASRELIKSRNPIAFAPKVVAISKQDETKDRPVTRHKRGCNCKKSQCLKKYCECFQAEVGCSEGCRCENCHNHYGRKDASEGVNNSEPICDSKEKEASEKEPGSLGRSNSGINKDSSPLSPTSQHKLHGRSTVRLRSSGKARPVDISLSQRTNPDNADLSEPLSKASLQIDTPQCTRPIDSSIDATSLDDSWNADTLTPFGPLNQNKLNSQWDEAGEMCTLTPVPQHPLRPTPGSIFTLPGEVSPLFSTQNADLSSYHKEFGVYEKPKESAERLACITHHRTSGSFAIGGKMANISYSDSDLRIPAVKPLSSPCTVANNCTASQCSQLWAADDSDMPDFLKDSEETPSPPRALASSPKQKRVTPPLQKGLPRAESSRIIGSVPGSSPGIKKGRKFILKALPPLPSLNSKGIT